MGVFGRHSINDVVACVLRDESHRANIPEFYSMGIAGAESSWRPNALGDEAAGPTHAVGPRTYNTYRDPATGRYYCSLGLLQLNICGGQGTGYSPESLLDARTNARIGTSRIAAAVVSVARDGLTGEVAIAEVAIRSGHPGPVARSDSRVRRIVTITAEILFLADGRYATWPTFDPTVCAGIPAPPPPLDTWSEGPRPASEAQAEAAIERHLDRIGELIHLF